MTQYEDMTDLISKVEPLKAGLRRSAAVDVV